MIAEHMIIFGIKNCDKVRAALKQAKAEGVNVQLHDFRVDGIERALVDAMIEDIALSSLLNKRSTTWKQLDEKDKESVGAGLLVKYPTLIKRPVIYENGQYRIGL